ncbi:unnamed protein product [Penicillium olsonii]|nr:unnamed protein product [Penicillium olsonii]
MTPNSTQKDAVPPIAVIGMSFRGPGDATNTEGLLRMVAESRESRSPVPKQKWNHEAFYHPDASRHGSHNVEHGHWFQQDVYEFDAPFFNISQPEAIALDPQQRMLLECSYEAFENSGTPMSRVIGTDTSVFAACFATDYTDMLWRDPETVPRYQCTNSGFSRANMANRVSFSFDLKGPSVTIDTACSGGLTALHLACQSLLSGDSRQAIVAGSSLILGPDVMITMSMMNFLSPDGRCYAFDERANGYARGEGVAVLLLKRLDDALADGDTIRAVIRGTGCNQDGKTPGITMPNGASQEALIRSVYQKTGLDPLDTSYVECHGTGTQAGDTTETGALRTVFCSGRQLKSPLIIGSVKTNIGHLEGASGLAGVIKSILMLENGIILPHRNFETANPRIPMREWALRVPTNVEPWISSSPRRASVNSFGYGGANVHAILESAHDYLRVHKIDPSHFTRTSALTVKEIQKVLDISLSNGHTSASVKLQNGYSNGHRKDHTNGPSFSNGYHQNGANMAGEEEDFARLNGVNGRLTHYKSHTKTQRRIFALSAFDPKAGEAWAAQLVDYVQQREDTEEEEFLDSLSFTLSNRRTTHSWKAAIAAESRQDLISQLKGSQFVNITPKTKLGLVFTGQGAQWCGMGLELIDAFPKFRESLEECESALIRLGAPFGVLEELQKDFESSQVNKAQYSQPLCTALQIGLVNLLDSWGIQPDSVTGHSSGEIAAAYCAGAISLEDAMLVAYARGCATVELSEKGVDGAMAAVSMSREELSHLLSNLQNGKASIACSNSPSSFTVSGDKSAVDELQQILRAQGVYNRRLVVGVAYHSHHMTLVADSYRAAIDNVQAKEGNNVKFFSSVTGKLTQKSKLGPEYWVSNLVSEVRFAQSLHQLAIHDEPNDTSRMQTLVEIGPHAALAGPMRQILQADQSPTKSPMECLSVLIRKKDAVTTALGMASSLFISGHSIQLSAVNQNSQSKIPPLIDLPSYAWNHTKSYNAESRISKAYREREHPRTDLLGSFDTHSSPLEPRWRQIIRLSELPWLRDHSIQSAIVYPAAGYITMAMEAVKQRVLWGAPGTQVSGYQFRDVAISSALLIPETPGEVEVVITLKAFAESVRSPSSLWDEFSVSSVSGENRWTEHCRGLIAVQTPPKTTNTVNGPACEDSTKASNQALVAEFDTLRKRRVETTGLYSSLWRGGMQYGPAFANMQEVRSAPGRSISQIEIPNTRAVMPMQYERASVIHPATLDSIFQTYLPALAEQMGQLDSPVIPVGIESMFIADNVPREPGDTLASYTSTTRKDNRFFSAEMSIFEGGYESGKRPVIHVGEMTMAALDRGSADEADDHARSRAFSMKWAPDVELLNGSQTLDVFRRSAKGIDTDVVQGSHSLPENIQLVATYVHLLAHKFPAQRILITGTRSGSAAVAFLSSLSASGEGITPFRSLHCADPSPNLDEVIQAQFPLWADSITYGEVEIGGLQGPYDVVMACNLLETSPDASATLSLVSRMVLPGGRLLLVDHDVETSADMSITNGYSPSDPKPLPAVESHARELGFNGCQTLCKGAVAFQMATEAAPKRNVSEVLIVVDNESSPDIDLSYLQSLFEKLNIAAEVVALKNAEPRPTQVCIMLTDLVRSSLAAPTDLDWASVKRIAHGGAGILWITRGAGGDICTSPEASLVQGFARTIRSETGDRPVVTLDLDGEYPLESQDAAGYIFNAVQRLDLDASGSNPSEHEFIERRGILHIPRLIEDIEATEKIQTDSGQAAEPKPSLRRLDEIGSSRLFVGTPGLLDTLHFAADERTNSTLQDCQIEVDVKATGINFKDVMMAMGQIPVEDLGCESSGTVSAIGDDIKNDPHGLRIGDRVMCLSSGSFCTNLRLDARLAERIPDSMSFETAAAIPITHVTAYHSLHNIARLRKGENILIHAAAGGLGQALVEMSQLAGAEVYVTVGSAEKKAFIMDRFGISEERILYSRDMSFARLVMDLTYGRGVDVIVNSLAGEALRQSWTCIAANGRFVELGQRDITLNTRLDMAPFARNASFTAFNLAFTMLNDPQAARNVLIQVLDLFRDGSLRGPDPLETYSFSDLQQAFRKMQTGRHMGKLVAVVKPDDMVKHVQSTAEGPLLRADASYLLVGGLGGIGRATALWMASRGARHLIFINRSGLESSGARETIAALQAEGCTASVFACDVADATQLISTLDTARQQSPPIRGVIQGAMVLRDCMLDKMSLENYLAVLRPKVQGTWNLHAHLPPDLDFFLMESSISGIIGNTAQAAYAAANTFLDAFARYRRSNNQPATTIDIGAVSGVGYLAQNEDLKIAMQRQGFDFTDEAGIMRLLEFSIRNSTRDVNQSHIITGLGAWSADTSLPALRAPLFSQYQMLSSNSEQGTKNEDTLAQVLKRCTDVGGASDVILDALVHQIVSHTGLPVENVSTNKSLQDYGIDSLAAVELKNWISKEMESAVPIFELMAAESLQVLAGKICGRSRLVLGSNGVNKDC